MKIKYSNKKVMEICSNEKQAIRTLGALVGKKLIMLMGVLNDASNLQYVMHISKYKLHQLKGDRKNQYALVIHNSSKYRLILYPLDNDGNIIEVMVNEDERLVETVMIEIMEVSEHYEK